MTRKPDITPAELRARNERDACVASVSKTILNGTLRDDVRYLVGRPEIVGHIEANYDLSHSQTYAAVSSMQAFAAVSSWQVVHNGKLCTTVCSLSNYMDEIRPALKAAHRAALPYAVWGRMRGDPRGETP